MAFHVIVSWVWQSLLTTALLLVSRHVRDRYLHDNFGILHEAVC